MRQLIIARKDLGMGAGKLSSQVAHASMAYFMSMFGHMRLGDDWRYHKEISMDRDVYEKWVSGIFTKTVCAAKNRQHLMKAAQMAGELGLVEGKDFFLIKDRCLTDLIPEETDESGNGVVLTCIGFRPLDDETAHRISKKYPLYH